MTMNSPASLQELHGVASANGDISGAVKNAELMREVGLKCIGFDGVSFVTYVHDLKSGADSVGKGTANNQLPKRLPRWSPRRCSKRSHHQAFPYTNLWQHRSNKAARSLIVGFYLPPIRVQA